MSRPCFDIKTDCTYFIDRIAFSALTPQNAPASMYIDGLVTSKNILWRVVENENIPENIFCTGSIALSRYKDSHYYQKLKFESSKYQNNVLPYTADSAVCCVADILSSYRNLSSWALLQYYLSTIKLVYVETGIDFSNLNPPSLSRLIKFVSTGKGSCPRKLLLYTEKNVYRYDKSAQRWNMPISDKDYKNFLRSGLLTVYVGSKNLKFKIYAKRDKIRVELAIRGRAAVSRFLNSPLCKEPSRHVTMLANLTAIKHLSSSFLDRLQELLGYLPRGAQEAVNRALDSFTSFPMPQAWEKPKQKQEPIPVFSSFPKTKAKETAMNINNGKRVIDGKAIKSRGINKVFLMPFFVRFVCLNSPKLQRARAPPKLFSRDFLFFAKFFLTAKSIQIRRCYCCFFISSPQNKR